MSERKAVIDMGTNTFHMLVADWDAMTGRWTPVRKHRIFVKLAEFGLGQLRPDAMERGLQAMIDFREQLDTFKLAPESVKAYGTAALRMAINGPEFLEEIYRSTGIRARAISGEEEARLIYLGVRQSIPWPPGRKALVMDIGGGSVEFSIADAERIYWRRSFNVGVAVLQRDFHHHDPIAADEVAAIEAFLEHSLQDLRLALQEHSLDLLIGAAGAFDTIDLFALDPLTKPPLYGHLPAAQFDPVYQLFVKSTLAERKAMPRLLPERVKMVVAAMVLVRVVLRLAGIREIYTSVYSMKEGMLVD